MDPRHWCYRIGSAHYPLYYPGLAAYFGYCPSGFNGDESEGCCQCKQLEEPSLAKPFSLFNQSNKIYHSKSHHHHTKTYHYLESIVGNRHRRLFIFLNLLSTL